ncbi:MAG: carbohydrate ABC transporter permease [Chloroflexota bacterium]|nr:carbohydrate ABC transporter permease [Chloroflexia bacterium]MDQ3444136.1 carbohydrate ABC transporter permease [Chloroflexota bacterium]
MYTPKWLTITTYLLLAIWVVIALFPLYWMVTLSFKNLRLITTGPFFIPWLDFDPVTLGWDDLFESGQRDRFLTAMRNSLVCAIGSGVLSLVLGSMAGYGLSRFSYRVGIWRNRDISFFFLSQLILPPAAVILPLYILFVESGLYDTLLGLTLLYTVVGLPIVIWIMRDQFDSLPVELEQAALVDGHSVIGAFLRIAVPIAAPGMVAAFILVVIFSWNEYLFSAVLTSKSAYTLPLLIATQVSSQGVKFWTMAAIGTATVAPLLVIAIMLERYIVRGLTAGAVK